MCTSSEQIWPKTLYSLSPTQMMLQIKFGCDRFAGCGDTHVCKWTDGHTEASSMGIL